MTLRTFYKKIFQSPYESQVMQLIGLIGLLRVGLALFQDFRKPATSTSEILTDVGIFLVFAALCVLTFRLRLTRVPLVLAAILILLLALNFIQFGGVTGYTEFNYMTGIAVVALLYSEKRKYVLIGLMLLILAFLLWSVYAQNSIYQLLFIKTQNTPEDFVYSLIALGILTFYLKYSMDHERDKLLNQHISLHDALKNSSEQQLDLQSQKEELLTMQEKLEEEVAIRTKELKIQNVSIEQYIRYNTKELQDPLLQMKQRLAEIKDAGMLYELLQISVAELETVIQKITNDLENEHASNKS